MLTEVSDVIACLVECPPVELEADDGKDDDGKEEEEGDVDQGTDGFCNGWHDHLETCGRKFLSVLVVLSKRENCFRFPA